LQNAEAKKNNVDPKTYTRARTLLVDAARTPGPWRRDAQQLLGKMPVASEAQPAMEEFASFAEAKLAGDAALGNLQTAEQAMSVVAMQVEQESTADRHEEIDEELSNSRENLRALRKTAIVSYRRALELVKSDTPIEDVTQTQFLLAYLMYQQEEYYDAAVLAEFVARERSDASPARSSIRTAMAAFSQLLEQNPQNPSFAEKHLLKLAEYAAQRWPQDEEGLTAVVTLVRLLVSKGRVADAQEYLDRIPATSPWRADAEITTGVALFREFQQAADADSEEQGPRSADLTNLRQVAQEMLEQGLRRAADADPTATTILATVTLAQLHLARGDPAAAL
jgi:tetratricopeptide (TPR) repeat protein